MKALWLMAAVALGLSGCGPLHTARQAARDRAECEREGYGGNSPEYRQCRAALVRHRAEVRQAAQDDVICEKRKRYVFDSPEYRQCMADLARMRADALRRMQQP